MKNDLTPFEKNLLKWINLNNKTNFTHKNFMEWNTDKTVIQKNLVDGEVMYEALGCFIAIKLN